MPKVDSFTTGTSYNTPLLNWIRKQFIQATDMARDTLIFGGPPDE
ncbi:MAG: hypothetical protein P8H43_06190 [Crocinitomicaceae bacterium]|nr:hypothetical protein [Crocinitomicaceae bacterium]